MAGSPNPYQWVGDKLVLGFDRIVAEFNDFPCLVRMRRLMESRQERIYKQSSKGGAR